jgi:Arc/MetJ family transcription regulator
MDVRLSTRTVLELTDLLTAAAAAPGATDADRLALDPATRAACDRWSTRLAAQLTAPPARRPLAIAS